jgi:hypothetical protein
LRCHATDAVQLIEEEAHLVGWSKAEISIALCDSVNVELTHNCDSVSLCDDDPWRVGEVISGDTMKIEDFATTTPVFRLEEFFHGKLKGWGTTLSRFGTLENRFTIEVEGIYDPAAQSLALKEIYAFDDGHTDTLIWTIIKRSDTGYEGREALIDGLAEGSQAGSAFNWTYTRAVPAKDGSKTSFRFADWFWLIEPNVMVAHASLTKLGIEVARLSAFYQKV